MSNVEPAATVTEEEVEQWFDDDELQEDGGESAPSAKSLEEKYAESQIQIVRSSIDFTLHTLQHSLRDPNYINFSPEYQRRARWDRKRRSLLIESFLMNIPIPPIFLFENQYNQYEAMDGRQRLETIREFLDNGFALAGMEYFTELNGKRFRDLNPTLQRGLLRRTLTAIVLLAETSRPDQSPYDVRMILFRRLNTGGARLNPQEMRNALYPGHFRKMLADTARGDLFTRIWRIPQRTPDEEAKPPTELARNAVYRSMADCELVLRFFTIRETIELSLKGSIRHLLDQCMDRHSDDSEAQVARLRALFDTCLGTLDNVFGGDPFVLPNTGRPSRPLYDALMVAQSFHLDVDLVSDATQIRERLAVALNDREKYEILIGRGNSIDAIKKRVDMADSILLG
jgi:DNA-binding transcriptional MerR regulator